MMSFLTVYISVGLQKKHTQDQTAAMPPAEGAQFSEQITKRGNTIRARRGMYHFTWRSYLLDAQPKD